MNTPVDQSLILIDGWQVSLPPAAEEQRKAVLEALDAVDVEDKIPANQFGQGIAEGIAEALGQVKKWMADVESVSKELRQPYHEQAKKIKAISDTFLLPVAQRFAQVDRKLAEYECEKKRIEQQLERRRQEEADRLRREEEAKQRAAEEERRRQEQAERDRLAAIERAQREEANAKRRAELEAEAAKERERQVKAEAEREAQRQAEQQQLATIESAPKYEAPKTEGVSVKTVWEPVDYPDPLAVLNWIRAQGFAWVNTQRLIDAIPKRELLEYLNAPGANHDIPGLTVRQVVASTVRKARGARVIDVGSTKVAM